MRLFQTADTMWIDLDSVRRVGVLNAGGQWHVCLWFDAEDFMVVDTVYEEDAADMFLQYWVGVVGGVSDGGRPE